jgi:hypothetical protein
MPDQQLHPSSRDIAAAFLGSAAETLTPILIALIAITLLLGIVTEVFCRREHNFTCRCRGNAGSQNP